MPKSGLPETSPDAAAIRAIAESELMPLMQRVVDYYETHIRQYYTLEVILKNMFTLGILSDFSRLAYQWCNENNAFLLTGGTGLPAKNN